MGIKKEFLKRSVEAIMKIDPSLDEEKVSSIVASKIKMDLKDPVVDLENDIKGIRESVKLTDFCNWIDKKKPIISGNATFYVQPEELESPTRIMLRDKKKGRSLVKKEMFKALAAGDDDKYRSLDLDQKNKKVIMNAEYGGSGAPTAAFYNKYTPSATTLMAQAIITTLAAFFEGILGDNQKFFHINEMFDWFNHIKKNDIDDFISIPSREEAVKRLKLKFITYNISHDVILNSYIANCSDKELAHIFYANNLKELFRRNDKISKILKNILVTLPLYEVTQDGTVPDQFKDRFKSDKEYNQWVVEEMFMNPYAPPECIKKDIDKLTDYFMKYCYVDYLTPDSIIKLNNHTRNTVLLVDTDSNVINSNIFVEFVLDELLSFVYESFGRKKIYNDIICVNILAHILQEAVSRLLEYYGIMHNINEESRVELSMKNEFMFRRLFLMLEKKRYVSSIVRKEGNILLPFKTDIKGVDFIKAEVTDEVTARFTKILEDRILFPENLQLKELNKDLKEFIKEIDLDLRNGGTRFLKPKSYKPEEAYKQVEGKTIAWRLPVFRAVSIWNLLYPDQKIYSMDRVKLIKLIVTKKEDMDIIKEKFSEEYNKVMSMVFYSNNLEIAKAGMKIIAIPNTLKEIPAWIIPLIDYENIVSDVLNSFRSILKAFKIEQPEIKTPNGKAKLLTGLISI